MSASVQNTRTLKDYRPQHDEDCRWRFCRKCRVPYSSTITAVCAHERDICSCGLEQALAVSREPRQEQIEQAISELDSILVNERHCFAEDSVAECFLGRVKKARVALEQPATWRCLDCETKDNPMDAASCRHCGAIRGPRSPVLRAVPQPCPELAPVQTETRPNNRRRSSNQNGVGYGPWPAPDEDRAGYREAVVRVAAISKLLSELSEGQLEGVKEELLRRAHPSNDTTVAETEPRLSPLTQFSDEDQRNLLELMRFVRYDKHTLLKALTFLRDQVGCVEGPTERSEPAGSRPSAAPNSSSSDPAHSTTVEQGTVQNIVNSIVFSFPTEALQSIARTQCDAIIAAVRAESHPALRQLIAQWRANADMLAEGNKNEHADPSVGMQRACADQLEALLSADTAGDPQRRRDV